MELNSDLIGISGDLISRVSYCNPLVIEQLAMENRLFIDYYLPIWNGDFPYP